MTRKALIAANWKMFKTPAEAKAFMEAFLPLVASHTRDEIALFAREFQGENGLRVPHGYLLATARKASG